MIAYDLDKVTDSCRYVDDTQGTRTVVALDSGRWLIAMSS